MTTGDEKTLNTSRQERFLKAVELLNSAHSYTRLGGVHALVALADEYLADKSLSEEEKHTEGQRIVDVLCAYIRSPFELTSHYYELIREELTGFYADSPKKFSADVRLSGRRRIFGRHLSRRSATVCGGPWLVV